MTELFCEKDVRLHRLKKDYTHLNNSTLKDDRGKLIYLTQTHTVTAVHPSDYPM